MKTFFNILIVVLISAGILFPTLLLKFDFQIYTDGKIISSKASEIGSWLAGTTGVLWGLASILLIYKSFELSRNQKEQDTFFQLMNNLHTITSDIKGDFIDHSSEGEKPKTFQGTAFFSKFLTEFKEDVKDYNIYFNRYLEDILKTKKPLFCKTDEKEPNVIRNEKKTIIGKEGNFTLKYINWSYEIAYKPYHSQLGHFFRMVYNIIKYVHTSKTLNKKEKKNLINLIQAQLTNDQLAVIFYNILGGEYEQFYKYVNEDYPDFFQNIDEKSLIQNSDIQYYSKAIFDYIAYPKNEPQAVGTIQ